MKRKTILAMTIVLCLGSSRMTVFAAPKLMSDGAAFDAEYYAQTYPDVAAVFGTDENLLYQHYLVCGKIEGRKPYREGDEVSVLMPYIARSQEDIELLGGVNEFAKGYSNYNGDLVRADYSSDPLYQEIWADVSQTMAAAQAGTDIWPVREHRYLIAHKFSNDKYRYDSKYINDLLKNLEMDFKIYYKDAVALCTDGKWHKFNMDKRNNLGFTNAQTFESGVITMGAPRYGDFYATYLIYCE